MVRNTSRLKVSSILPRLVAFKCELEVDGASSFNSNIVLCDVCVFQDDFIVQVYYVISRILDTYCDAELYLNAVW